MNFAMCEKQSIINLDTIITFSKVSDSPMYGIEFQSISKDVWWWWFKSENERDFNFKKIVKKILTKE